MTRELTAAVLGVVVGALVAIMGATWFGTDDCVCNGDCDTEAW
jgi:hypothetical protein